MTVDNRPKVKTKKEVRDLKAEALKIANMIHIEGQSKAETKQIASGIQRGMEMFLRQQSERGRELDKRANKIKQMSLNANQQMLESNLVENQSGSLSDINLSKLPWILLTISWLIFLAAAYLFLR